MSGSQPQTPPARRLAVLTFGCKVNQYESAYMVEQAVTAGWRLADPEAADLLVINSCTVTSRADRQVRQALRQAGRRHSPSPIVVTGCYAQRSPAELASFPGVRAVLGNAAKTSWLEVASHLPPDGQPCLRLTDMAACRSFQPMPISHFQGHTRAFVKIQDGCSQNCTYCIVPTVRGPERSLPPDQVLSQLQTLVQHGSGELVLTGINLSRYGQDLPDSPSLATLCRALKKSGWPARLRLSSLEPQDLSLQLLQELAAWPQFCPHFHIPLQSGADAVLRAMHRSYDAAWFADLVQQIVAWFPSAAIGLDVLVGFPTETPADFAQTRDLLARLPLTYLHVFPYSPRPHTPAAQLRPRNDRRQIETWARELRALAADKKQAFYQRHLGQIVEVLVEGALPGQPGLITGLTANYLRVHCPGPAAWAKQIIRVKLSKLAGGALFGLPVS